MSLGAYPEYTPAQFCPLCGKDQVRRLTKNVLPATVHVRWICEKCTTLFDVFMRGK